MFLDFDYSGLEDFVKTVLSWSFQIFEVPLSIAIEHGRSMNVLLLKTKKNEAFPEMQFLALVPENGNSITNKANQHTISRS